MKNLATALLAIMEDHKNPNNRYDHGAELKNKYGVTWSDHFQPNEHTFLSFEGEIIPGVDRQNVRDYAKTNDIIRVITGEYGIEGLWAWKDGVRIDK